VPMFLVRFMDPDTMTPLIACPKSLLKRMADKARKQGMKPMAGAEYEVFHFKTPVKDNKASVAAFLKDNVPHALEHITDGMFGYSLTQPVNDLDYYYDVLRTSSDFACDVESWHPESGPGVLEAVCCDWSRLQRSHFTGTEISGNLRNGGPSCALQVRQP
jgi:glutamine synthetase